MPKRYILTRAPGFRSNRGEPLTADFCLSTSWRACLSWTARRTGPKSLLIHHRGRRSCWP